MADDKVYIIVLPSGRVAKVIEPTLERTWEVTEQAGARVGSSTNAAKQRLEIDRELVRVHLRAITRAPVPWAMKPEAEPLDLDALRAEVLEMLEGDAAAENALTAVRQRLGAIDVQGGEVDVDAMVQAARDGAGGGFQTVTYKDMVSAKGELSIKGLFNNTPRDFSALVVQINMLSAGKADPKAPPAAALLGRRVIEITT